MIGKLNVLHVWQFEILEAENTFACIYCVRVSYRLFDIRAHLTERNDVDVICPVNLDSGTQHQHPEQPLQANSVRLFLARDTRRVVCAGEMALSSESQTGD